MAARLAAWLVTGPLGHFYAGLADLTSLLARLAGRRARARLRRLRSRRPSP